MTSTAPWTVPEVVSIFNELTACAIGNWAKPIRAATTRAMLKSKENRELRWAPHRGDPQPFVDALPLRKRWIGSRLASGFIENPSKSRCSIHFELVRGTRRE